MTLFLYTFLGEIIYVKQLHLFELYFELVCRLRKTLYRLKHAPQVWYKTPTDFLKKLGLKRLELDQCILVSQDWQLFLAIYVNDLIFFASDKTCLIAI